MFHEVAVPQGLEDGVCESQGQNVLDRFLAEVVIDPEDLTLGENGEELVVEPPGAFEVGAEGLLDNDPPPPGALVEAGPAELAGDDREELRRRGEVEKNVAPGAGSPPGMVQVPGKYRIGIAVFELAADVGYPLCKARPAGADFLAPGLEPRVLHDPLVEQIPKGAVAQIRQGKTDHVRLRMEEPLAGEAVQGRHELAGGQIARGAEDHDGAGIGLFFFLNHKTCSWFVAEWLVACERRIVLFIFH